MAGRTADELSAISTLNSENGIALDAVFCHTEGDSVPTYVIHDILDRDRRAEEVHCIF